MTETTKKRISAGAVDIVDRTSATMCLDKPVSTVKGVSDRRAKALAKMGIRTVRDMLQNYPRRYVDLSKVETVRTAVIGEQCTIMGRIHEMKLKRPKQNLVLVEITLVDETGTLLVTAFRQPWLMDTLAKDMMIAVAGKVEFDYGFKRMTNPFIESLDADHEGGVGMIVPVHPACNEISTAWMRRLTKDALADTRGLEDFLPLDLRCKYRLMARGNAFESLHFPESMGEVAEARRRMVYEEVFLLELALMQDGARRQEGVQPTAHVTDGEAMLALLGAIPFALTQDQLKAVDEILAVLAKPSCANHMLLGDVGTGKTVIAAFAMAAAADTGNQAVMMAPTEVLARQYAQSLGSLMDAAGVSWGILTGTTPAAERQALLEGLKQGSVQVLFGTHAVLEDDVVFRNCSLCIIDEQQRFGVQQRAALLAKGVGPDALYLTATPIPRSLALALFGNLTLSYLKERPNKGAERTTQVLSRGRAQEAYDAARAALDRGEQVYVVCPLVGLDTEERDKKAKKSSEDAEDKYDFAGISIEADGDYAGENIKAAETHAKVLQETIFHGYNVALLHGKLNNAAKQQTMEEFRKGDVQVLVATTVIEVGVDVPNATVMIIEDADRFGLSQLHQLRGRVGRGSKSAQVFLVSNSQTPVAVERLAAMERTDDGFELASYDLSLRREGEILGNRQHGASSLKLVNVIRDAAIIDAAHSDARYILDRDPDLAGEEHRALAREVRQLRGATAVLGG